DLRRVRRLPDPSPDRARSPGTDGLLGQPQGLLDGFGAYVEVAVLDPATDPGVVALDADRHAVVHGDRERLGAAHAAESRGQGQRAGQRSTEPFGGDGRERLVGALQDAL